MLPPPPHPQHYRPPAAATLLPCRRLHACSHTTYAGGCLDAPTPLNRALQTLAVDEPAEPEAGAALAGAPAAAADVDSDELAPAPAPEAGLWEVDAGSALLVRYTLPWWKDRV